MTVGLAPLSTPLNPEEHDHDEEDFQQDEENFFHPPRRGAFKDGASVLMSAAAFGRAELVKVLLEAGADVCICSHRHNVPPVQEKIDDIEVPDACVTHVHFVQREDIFGRGI